MLDDYKTMEPADEHDQLCEDEAAMWEKLHMEADLELADDIMLGRLLDRDI